MLANLTYSGFRPSTDLQLVPIRQIELARERSKVEGDGNMAADDRSRKLKEIDTRLAELDRQLATVR